MKIEHHISVLFLTPVIGFILTIIFFPIVETNFPSFTTFYPIVTGSIVVLLSFATHFLQVSCPKCGENLTFDNDPLPTKPRYQCKSCHFERKGFSKSSSNDL